MADDDLPHTPPAPEASPEASAGAPGDAPPNAHVSTGGPDRAGAPPRREPRLPAVVGALGILGIGITVAVFAVVRAFTGPDEAPQPTERVRRYELSTPTTSPLVGAVLAFFEDFQTAIAERDVAFLLRHLHPAVIERYGEEQCRRTLRGFDEPPSQLLRIAGPAPWTWEADGRATRIDQAVTLTVRSAGLGPRDIHLALTGGRWRFFTDCGDPLPRQRTTA